MTEVKQEETILWGDKSITGSRPPVYNPQLVGATDRIFFVKKELIIKRVHYIEGAGYIKCNQGKCCALFKEPSFRRIGTVIFKYDCDKNGELPVDANGVPIVRGSPMLMIMTENMFAKFNTIHMQAVSDTEGKENLNSVDTRVHIATEHKKKYKQWDVSLARRSFFMEWAMKGKSDRNPNGDPLITDKVREIKAMIQDLGNKLNRELCRELDDAEITALATGGAKGAMSPDDLPNVGDPTDALNGL